MVELHHKVTIGYNSRHGWAGARALHGGGPFWPGRERRAATAGAARARAAGRAWPAAAAGLGGGVLPRPAGLAPGPQARERVADHGGRQCRGRPSSAAASGWGGSQC